MRPLPLVILAGALLVVGGGSVPRAADDQTAFSTVEKDAALASVLNRVSGRVLQYYDRAQSIIATETVQTQLLGVDMAPTGPARRLVYELRTEWRSADAPDATPEVDVVRKLLSIDGHAPDPNEEPGCTDPRAVQPEPLFMLLPEHRREYIFSIGKPQKLGARAASLIDYSSLAASLPQATFDKECVSITLDGRTTGSIWIDAETGDVLQLKERLIGMIDIPVPRETRTTAQTWMSLERSDFTVRYKTVSFTDPEETVVLPASMEATRVLRAASVTRVRITETYSGYRRFLTGARVLPPPV